MKKNFFVTTGLIDSWESGENNFLLGRWCEFPETDNSLKKKSDTNIIKNAYYWDNNEKKNKDYEYLEKKTEYLLEEISKKLSDIHNIQEDKEYWRVIIYTWLSSYTTTIFERWENIRIFFENNKTEKFYSNFILFKDQDYIPKNHLEFIINSQKDSWNHLIFLRILNFLNIPNLSLIKKDSIKNKEKKIFNSIEAYQHQPHKKNFMISLVDYFITKLAFKFNKIIIESFYFPRKEYLQICLKYKLIPSKYLKIFNFNIKEDNFLKGNKREKFKNLLSKFNTQDKFIEFLLHNIYKDIPKSYIENFEAIKKKILPFSKKKKIIFSMHSIVVNDNFKIYIAETKKIGSKYIHAEHGGGLTFAANSHFDFFEKISDKIIRWDNTEQKKNIYFNLSPTLPTIVNSKNEKDKDQCSIIFVEPRKYLLKYHRGPGLDQSINYFNELTQFVNNLDIAIKSKIKFRMKGNYSYYSKKFFLEIFGKESIEEVSDKNSYEKTMLNSRLIIVTYPETAFSQAMYSNIPTILITKKEYYPFTKTALKTFDILKKNKIAFEDFNEAKDHVNKYWKELDIWWGNEEVQSARKNYLTNFFNVRPEWYKEWSDYISLTLSRS